MTKKELLLYDTPSIAEHISWDFLQTIIAKYTAWKINRKVRRYEYRVIREKYFSK